MGNSKKKYIPWFLIAILSILLPITGVFGIAFVLGLYTGKYLVGPWTNLMLFTAAGPLLEVDIVGLIEIWMGFGKGTKKKEKE